MACAREKTAYVTAVTQGYKPGDFDLIVINASPCGGCRQWHIEFKVDRVIFANNDGELVEYTADELLPDTFVRERSSTSSRSCGLPARADVAGSPAARTWASRRS